MKHTIYLPLYILLLVIGLSSCTDDFAVPDRPTYTSEYITFAPGLNALGGTAHTRAYVAHLGIEEENWALHATESDSRVVRSAPYYQLSGEAGVVCVHNNNTARIIDNQVYTFDGDLLKSTEEGTRWSTVVGTTMSAYTYVPYSEHIVVSPTTVVPTLSYTVPQQAQEQLDILTASKTISVNPESKLNESISLTYNHALTAIRFKMGFACKLKSIKITHVANTGTYDYNNGWSNLSGDATFSLTFGDGRNFAVNDLVNDLNTNDSSNDEQNTFMMLPQTLADNSEVIVTYDDNGTDKTIRADIGKAVWKAGRLITYTLYESAVPQYIYFDLAAGMVTLNSNASGTLTYSGKVFVKGSNGSTTRDITGSVPKAENPQFYVYQTIAENRDTTGYDNTTGTYTLPTYQPVTWNGVAWSDYITNNTVVENVIENWVTAVAQPACKREATNNWIDIDGANRNISLNIDNVYSNKQTASTSRTDGGISYIPAGSNGKLYINIIGDNRVGNVHYYNTSSTNGSEIIFEGTGSLTVADVDGKKVSTGSDVGITSGSGYYSNHWNAAIGANDNTQEAYGIVINGGVIYAGTTKAENCSAIGGGGNGSTTITINGGIITAVATTTGTAIGGGIGFHSAGGIGNVRISGGNVYAYNHANRWNIPSSAIGGAGSSANAGNKGSVYITGGNIYAQSELGTAIGGGSSQTKGGGSAQVEISGGVIVAKSLTGTSIGGGSACTGSSNSSSTKYNGGDATVIISGNPIIRTGSIGGGLSNDPKGGTIGKADITISGGDIQAQFVMSSGSSSASSLKMTGGTIRNSDVNDKNYYHVRRNGGAVFLEYGTMTMSGGTIRNCYADNGGAVFIQGESNSSFIMSGGTIEGCTANGHGGAVYLEGDGVEMSGNAQIVDNLTQGGNGGGIYIRKGDFSMQGNAQISGNSAYSANNIGGSGGGLYVSTLNNDLDVNILSGNITNNTCDRYGGGINVDMKGSSNRANVVVGIEGNGNTNPNISGNMAVMNGGGLYAEGENATVTINSGRIMDNATMSYVPNPNIANEGGTVTLKGGDVTHVVITYDGNGGTIKDSTETTATQKIVTQTNSRLEIPSFERFGYILVGWNTRADGMGTNIDTTESMNTDQNMTLYAQWVLQQ